MVGRIWTRLTGDLDRKGFWIGFAICFAVSLALTDLWYRLAQVWLDGRPLLVIAPIRLLLIGPQLLIYVRRLHHAGRSGKWVLCLLALYTLGLAVLPHYLHRLDDWGAQLTPMRLHAPDESTANVQAHYDNDLENTIIIGAGALTGLPGPLQLAFAVWVGRLRPSRRQ